MILITALLPPFYIILNNENHSWHMMPHAVCIKFLHECVSFPKIIGTIFMTFVLNLLEMTFQRNHACLYCSNSILCPSLQVIYNINGDWSYLHLFNIILKKKKISTNNSKILDRYISVKTKKISTENEFNNPRTK